MAQLTKSMIRRITNFRADLITALTADLNAGMAVDAVSASGACALDKVVTELSVDSTKAYTLAAPTAVNQRKTVRCVAATNTPAGTLTVTSPDNVTGFVCPSTFFFDNVGQEIELEATAALKWRCIRKKRTGVKAITVGTTPTAGVADMTHFNLSVTGTVSSALPNGAAVGEIICISMATPGGSPVGTLTGAYVKKDGTAGTTLSNFVNATDQATLMWTGAAWRAVHLTPNAVLVIA